MCLFLHTLVLFLSPWVILKWIVHVNIQESRDGIAPLLLQVVPEHSIQVEIFLCVYRHVFPVILAGVEDVDHSLVLVEKTLAEGRLVLEPQLHLFGLGHACVLWDVSGVPKADWLLGSPVESHLPAHLLDLIELLLCHRPLLWRELPCLIHCPCFSLIEIIIFLP